MPQQPLPPSRRAFLGRALACSSLCIAPPLLVGCGGGGGGGTPAPVVVSKLAQLGPLQAPDVNGLRLPAGFTSRIVARAGGTLAGSSYTWHQLPDGGATFAMPDGGWVYVSNSEVDAGAGGVGALRFDAAGTLVSQYPLLAGTSRNCSGGPTPWGTWMSCEEIGDGRVWECQPDGSSQGIVRPALGIWTHEAVAVDPVRRQIFMTEDQPDGRLYRFVPSATDWPAGATRPTLADGVLQALVADTALPAPGDTTTTARVRWKDVLDPARPQTAVRDPEAAAFNGGEGVFYFDGQVYFTTQGDNRVWKLDIAANTLRVIYDATVGAGELTGVDNITISRFGDVLAVESPGNLEIRLVAADGTTTPIVQVTGQGSALSGPALSPDGQHLYFSSQVGPGLNGALGLTYEVSGPFYATA